MANNIGIIADNYKIDYIEARPWRYSDVSYWINPNDGCCNATIEYHNKKTRLRASMLIFKEDSVLLCKDPEEPESFSLPGGGLEENETAVEAAIREAREEVCIITTNVIDTGFDYCECHEKLKDWVVENVPKKQQWYNYYTCLVMADFVANYTGKIDKVDQDPEMKNTATWHKIKDVLLDPTVNPQWKKAIKLHATILNVEKSDRADKVTEDVKKGTFGLNITSPKKLMAWMNANIDYKLDIDSYSDEAADSIQTAEEILESKHGHCVEQSYLEYKIFTDLGYKCHLIFMKENSSKYDFGV